MIDEAYVIAVDKTGWELADGAGDVRFTWSHDSGREQMLNLYREGVRRQWDANERIDWDLELDLDDPLGAPEELVPIYGSTTWDKLSDADKGVVRRHMVAWQFSQFLHGELATDPLSREEFTVEACWAMRDRFLAEDDATIEVGSK